MADLKKPPPVSFSGTSTEPGGGPPVDRMARLGSFTEVNDVLKSRQFAHVVGHRDNAPFLRDSLLSLSGDAHFLRRRIVATLFRPEALQRYETDVFMPALRAALAAWPVNGNGRASGDLTAAVYRALGRLSAAMVGLDGIDDEESIARHLLCTQKISVGVNIEFVERDHKEVVAECMPFVEEFRDRFFLPSLRRREALLAQQVAGEMAVEDLPFDLIMLMLLHREHYESFGADTMLREAMLFNGAGGGINHAACNAIDTILRWADADPGARRELLSKRHFVRRAALEAIRVRPATPFQIRRSTEDHELASGRQVTAGEFVLLDMTAANRDRDVFGADADKFDPFRSPIERVKPAGLAFSNGAHTCIAMNLSVGDGNIADDGPAGLLVALLLELFGREIRRDVFDAAEPKQGTTRNEYERFPVSLRAESGGAQ